MSHETEMVSPTAVAAMTLPHDPLPDPFAADHSYLNTLNPTQRQAVEALDGPVLVLAGAGTGKTRVLTTRLAHLLMSRPLSPFQVMAVTFTNKAALEMRERVGRLVGQEPHGWWLGTFHALAARILRRHAPLVGLQDNFTILDADDQLRLIKQLMEIHHLDQQTNPAKSILAQVQKWKDRGEEPHRVTGVGTEDQRRILRLYEAYQERLKSLNVCDFGDLLLHNLTIFREHPDVLQEWQNRFRYVLVDEYQDTNLAQYLWLRLLAQAHHNLCCVGDDDQSIYGWRGAEVGNILRFEQDFPGAQLIRLEQNYRSTGHILGAASGLIAKNRERLGKTLWTEADKGEKVVVRGLWDSEEEARWIGEEIEAAQRKKMLLSDMAILVRAGFQTREFEERFAVMGVPYRVIGGARFYERAEIRDALAYLRLLQQPADDLAFERIINLPARGVGPAKLKLIRDESQQKHVSLFQATAQLCERRGFPAKLNATLTDLVGNFARWRQKLEEMPHPQVASLVLDETGYLAMWRLDKSPEAPGRIENLKELITAMAAYESLGAFLEHVALVMELSETAGEDAVTLMTLHAAKGLEFDLVFLPGWEEGIFPSLRSLEESGEKALQEERRLAYVGLTRARKKAVISYVARRRIRGMWEDALPSRFIGDLPSEHIEPLQSRGLYAPLAGRLDARTGLSGWSSSGSTFSSPSYRTAVTAHSFSRGVRISHKRFGEGLVQSVEGDKLTIAFDDGEVKQIIASYVTLADE